MTMLSEVATMNHPVVRPGVLRAVKDLIVLRHFVSITVFAPVFDGTKQHYRVSLLHYYDDNVIPVPWLIAGMQLHFGVNVRGVIDELMVDLMPTVDLVRSEIHPLDQIVSQDGQHVIHPVVTGVSHVTFEAMCDYQERLPMRQITTCTDKPKPNQIETYIHRALAA